MLISGVKISKDLVGVIESNNFVIFDGAGVSFIYEYVTGKKQI